MSRDDFTFPQPRREHALRTPWPAPAPVRWSAVQASCAVRQRHPNRKPGRPVIAGLEQVAA
jgi:hypothetical protein